MHAAQQRQRRGCDGRERRLLSAAAILPVGDGSGLFDGELVLLGRPGASGPFMVWLHTLSPTHTARLVDPPSNPARAGRAQAKLQKLSDVSDRPLVHAARPFALR
jgi:hypothetical protein